MRLFQTRLDDTGGLHAYTPAGGSVTSKGLYNIPVDKPVFMYMTLQNFKHTFMIILTL